MSGCSDLPPVALVPRAGFLTALATASGSAAGGRGASARCDHRGQVCYPPTAGGSTRPRLSPGAVSRPLLKPMQSCPGPPIDSVGQV